MNVSQVSPKICKTILCFNPSLLVFTKTSCFAGVRCWQNIFTLHILCLSLSLSLSSCCNFLCHRLCLPFCICLPFVFVGWQCRVNQYVSRVYQAITGSQPPWEEWDRWKKRMLTISYSKIGNLMVPPNFVQFCFSNLRAPQVKQKLDLPTAYLQYICFIWDSRKVFHLFLKTISSIPLLSSLPNTK